MFFDEMKKTLDGDSEFNVSYTENAALGYKTTGKKLLDLNYQVASLRSADESYIKDLYKKAFYEDKLMALKWLFFASDVREGLGERRLFRVILKDLAVNNPDYIGHLLEYIPEYSRWDNILEMLETGLEHKAVEIIKKQLAEDKKNKSENKPVSLLAKWLPSANTSSKETVRKARKLCGLLGMDEKEYRKTLSDMRKYIDVVEIKMSAKQWGGINYEAVPSRANLIYNAAFLRNDEQRRREYLEKLEKGEVKINAGVLYPHDIVHSYISEKGGYYDNFLKPYDSALENLWKNLPDLVQDNGSTIVVADGSGSMMCPIGNTNVSALSVANALAIYFAEKLSGEFKDKYITFSANPQLVDFSRCDSLKEKIELAFKYNEVANTNIEAVFDLILSTAKRAKMKQEDLPGNILILSDMEFDHAVHGAVDQRLFKNIGSRYGQSGYKLPRLVFWNLNSRTWTIPVIENDLGAALVSGFSVNIVKMVLSGEIDPYKCLIGQLTSERYAKIIMPVAE